VEKNSLNALKDRIFNKKKKEQQSGLTAILDLARGLGCFSDIIGKTFEVLDNNGNIVYTIKQKPISIKLLNTLLKEYNIIKRIDAENEAAKWGKNKKKNGRK